MIKNYIFDFGNVFARFVPYELTACVVQDEKARKLICEAIFCSERWEKLDLGSVDEQEMRDIIINSLPSELKDDACKVFDNWIGNMPQIDGMQQIVDDIKKTDKKLYLLSNISKRFARTYHEYPWIKELFEKFDGLVFSGEVGLIKPDRAIFKYVLKKYNLKAQECLFIDDNEANVQAAEDMGIKGYLFDGSALKLKEFLKNC